MTESKQASRAINLDDWVTAAKAMQLLGVSRSWLKHLRDSDAIEARDGGYAWLYYVPSLNAYRNQHDARRRAKLMVKEPSRG